MVRGWAPPTSYPSAGRGGWGVRACARSMYYASGYTDEELDAWAQRCTGWRSEAGGARDVYVYFDNDAKVHAPYDALRLAERLGVGPGAVTNPGTR